MLTRETPALDPSPRSNRRGRGAAAWAHPAALESYSDAKLRSREWRSYGFRISPEVLTRLKARVNADTRSTGLKGLAIGHYIDAALRRVAPDVELQKTLALAFEEAHLFDEDKSQPSSYRVGHQAYDMMSNLKLTLSDVDFGRKGTLVVSGAIEMFLDAMASEGELRKPERKSKST